MTPNLYAKLSKQITRQTAERAAYQSDIEALQPSIDSAQAWVDACQASVDAAQAKLTAAQARPDDAPEDWQAPDTTAQQDALNAATATLESAKADLATPTAKKAELQSHVSALDASLAQCQAEIDAGGIALTQAEVDAVANAPVVPAEVTYRQAKTFMELTPDATHGDMWLAALAAANAIPDSAQRIIMRNFITDSQVYEREKVHAMCGLLGMTPAQADQMMVAAAKL